MVIEINHKISGSVNNEHIMGSGKIEMRDGGEFNANLNFNEYPISLHPYVFDNSKLSIFCVAGAKNANGRNILEITNGKFLAVRTYVIESPQNKVEGSFISILEAKKISDNQYESKLEIYGKYSGPVNLKTCSDYEVEMKQTSPGRIEGQHKAYFLTDDDEKYTIHVSTEYLYTNDNKTEDNLVCKVNYKHLEAIRLTEGEGSLSMSTEGIATAQPLN
ncbi:hypothetical protein ACQCWD_07585 [Bacillus thuringiensis]|uniref:Uncharacterized protein n=1 Tax=Bacillus cereus TaxID=1396 RepID=A0AAN5XQS7_BACCE|nr:hypothetical protein [Bacillus cereus]KAB2448997.1 hypothetical protein F8165_16755 [Bacillus cereus]KAB2482342.1 hypothetical protein F8157_26705 [Bacillus cereus]